MATTLNASLRAPSPQFELPWPTTNDLERRYREWIRQHPNVLGLFLDLARAELARDRRFGIGELAERVRWEIRTTWAADYAGFKINNSYRAYIARDLIARLPGLGQLLKTRKIRRVA